MRVVTAPDTPLAPGNFDFHNASHPAVLLGALQELRMDRRLADVILRVGEKDFHCHRNILAASSSYFKSMFLNNMKESCQGTVVIRGISPSSMELVLDYIYTSRVSIKASEVWGLLSAADLLQVLSVKTACESFLDKHIRAENCFGIYSLAERHFCKELSRNAWAFALENFSRVCCHDEILQQSHSVLIKYLSSDELVVASEEDVCETIMKWALVDADRRNPHVHVLLTHLRSHLLPRKYLIERVLSNDLIASRIDTNTLFVSSFGGSEIFAAGRLSMRRTRSRKVIVVAGGVGPANTKLRDVKFYDPADRRWGTLTQLPSSADSVSCVEVVDNDIYVTGFRGNVTLFRTTSRQWDVLAFSEIEAGIRQRRASAVLDGFIYQVGGYDGTRRLARVDRFDTRTKRWEEVTPLPYAVSSPAAVSYGRKLYVFGGAVSNESATDRVQCYDPATDQWLPRAPMPHVLSGIAARVLGDYIYVVGCISQIVHRYNPDADSWGQVTSMCRTRALCSAAVCDGKLYVTGGEDQPSSLTDSMECYDPVTNRWTPCYGLPYPVKLHSCVTIIKRL